MSVTWKDRIAQGIEELPDGTIVPFRPWRKNSLLVMSDIHRGASISALPEHEASLKSQMAGFEHVVMNGDNFEMFYIDRAFYGFKHNIYDFFTADMRELISPEFWKEFSLRTGADAHTVVKKAIDESTDFLEDFLKNNPQTTLHFILGNHELIHKFRHKLDGLQEKYPNFEWSPEAIKIANSLFVHGDLAMDGPTQDGNRAQYGITDEERETHRLREAKNEMGWVKLLNQTMERPGQAVVNYLRKPETCIPILDHWLMRHNGMPELQMSEDRVHKPFRIDGIKHIFFGHTHVKFSYLPSTIFPGVHYHNTGALTKTVMNQRIFGRPGHGMLQADIHGGKIENIRPFDLENNRGELAAR